MYLARRLFSILVTLWIALTIVFVLFRLLPGDPASALLGPLSSQEARDNLTESLGLDKPMLEQYGIYLGNLVQLDLGTSFSQRLPVMDVVWPAFVNSLILVLATFIVAYGLGALLGVVLAWYRGTRFEAIGSFAALALRGAPTFWIAILLVSLFALNLKWLPAAGMTSIQNTGEVSLSTYLSWDFVKHLILPVAAASIYALGLPLLLVRNSMLDVIGTPYVELARAKGLSQKSVMFKHAARNAMLPAVTASAQFIAWAMGGLVVVENVFSWPGLGTTIVDALEVRDYQLAQGALASIAALVVSLMLIADLVTAYLDPRVKLS